MRALVPNLAGFNRMRPCKVLGKIYTNIVVAVFNVEGYAKGT